MEEERVEGVHNVGCIQEAFRGFLKCLGLENGGEGGGGGDGKEVADNPPPPSSPLNPPTTTTTYETLPSVDHQSSTVDPLVEVLSSPIDNATITTMDINNNLGGGSNFSLVTIDEIINTNGGTTAEAHYVDLIESNGTNMSLLTTRLISSGGGGKTH